METGSGPSTPPYRFRSSRRGRLRGHGIAIGDRRSNLVASSALAPGETGLISTHPPVFVFTAPNPGPKTLDGTHTYVVGRQTCYVLDPGPDDPSYGDLLAGWLHQEGAKLHGILLTHSHPDHALGARYLADLLGGVPIWASEHLPERDAALLGVSRRFTEATGFPVDGDVLQVIETPGHTHDHVAFWLTGARILFSGDTILGLGSTLVAPPEGDMRLYMRSLDRIGQLEPRLIAPGHGPLVTDPAGKIAEYVGHRRQREAQLLEALQQGPAGAEDLVRRVYTDLDPRLHRLAIGSVKAQLEKLEAEGKVMKVAGAYRIRWEGEDYETALA